MASMGAGEGVSAAPMGKREVDGGAQWDDACRIDQW